MNKLKDTLNKTVKKRGQKGTVVHHIEWNTKTVD